MPTVATGSRMRSVCGSNEGCDGHAQDLTGVLTRSPSEVAAWVYLARSGLCGWPGRVKDGLGRSLLHVASSTGQAQVVEWLVRCHDAALNERDRESGYTALHRSLFYGQVHVAVKLLDLGSNLHLTDQDGLMPLDHVVRDQPRPWELSRASPCEIYTWGANANFNLGLESQPHKAALEAVEVFRHERVLIRDAVMQKFHTVFLAANGRVYVCGHGRGGRLGLGTEDAQLSPRLVAALSAHEVIQVALGTDHSLFLTSTGSVWTCGSNDYHQLGHGMPTGQVMSVPQVLSSPKGAKYPSAVGVAGARFHSLFWTITSLYTWGLNAGQLGHLKGDHTVPHPKLVTSLHERDRRIESVVCSDATIVILTQSGEILGLYEYQTRRIVARQFGVSQIAVLGGQLDSHVTSEKPSSRLVEAGGRDLKLFVLFKTGRLAVWEQKRGSQMSDCTFNLNFQVNMSNFALSRSSLIFTTREGLAFKADLDTLRPASVPKESSDTPLSKRGDKSNMTSIKAKRLPGLYRCTAAFCDPKGQNFGLLQAVPNELLTEFPEVEASTMRADLGTLLDETNLHDVAIKVQDRLFHAHKFILASASDQLSNQLVGLEKETELELPGIDPIHFEQILRYAYTKTCSFLVPGPCPAPEADSPTRSQPCYIPTHSKHESAFAVAHKQKSLNSKSSVKDPSSANNHPLQLFQESAKSLGFHGLVKALDTMKWAQGAILYKDPNRGRKSGTPRFSRKSFPELNDVTIKAEDGIELSAHKCILVARSEYFRGMFTCQWMEAQRGQILSLPVSSKILPVLLDYLYRDEAAEVARSDEAEFVCNLMVVADQFLLDRLVNLCESQICSLLSLKNVAEIFQVSLDFNAANLQRSCMQFICHNLGYLLESKSLTGIVSEVGLERLSLYYRKDFLNIRHRVLASAEFGPTSEEIEAFYQKYPMSPEELLEEELALKHTRKSSEKKSGRQSSAEKKSLRVRNISTSSMGSNRSEELDSSLVKELESDLSLDELELQGQVDLNANVASILPNVTPPAAVGGGVFAGANPTVSSFFQAKEPKASPISLLNKKFTKKSQKERKKEMQPNGGALDPQSPPEKPTWGGWGSLESTPNGNSNLSQIIRSQSKDINPPAAAKERRPRKISWKQLSFTEEPKPVDAAPVQSPWKINPTPLNVQDLAVPEGDADTANFKDILNSEVKQNASLTRAKSKPLLTTQREEKAIEELRLFYNADNVFDERITVVRVDHGPLATPIWKRRSNNQ